MGPGLRKAALTVHVASSLGWLGAVGVFLTLAVAGTTSDEQGTIRAAYVAMELATRFVIVPLALATVVSGVVQALGTPWGLLRHWWVVIKLVVTVVAVLVLLQQLDPIRSLGEAAAAAPLGDGDLEQARSSLVLHAGSGLLVLLVPTVLSIYKPRGLTGYGRRKLRQGVGTA
jgi:hypothetical protein